MESRYRNNVSHFETLCLISGKYCSSLPEYREDPRFPAKLIKAPAMPSSAYLPREESSSHARINQNIPPSRSYMADNEPGLIGEYYVTNAMKAGSQRYCQNAITAGINFGKKIMMMATKNDKINNLLLAADDIDMMLLKNNLLAADSLTCHRESHCRPPPSQSQLSKILFFDFNLGENKIVQGPCFWWL